MAVRVRGLVGIVAATAVLSSGVAVAQDHGVDVQDNDFAPATVTITAGDRVTWTQSGSNPHSVTADDDSFDSHPNCPPVCMGNGDEYSQTFEQPGEYGYYCKIHGAPGGGMSGTVVVQASGDGKDPADEPDEPDREQDDADGGSADESDNQAVDDGDGDGAVAADEGAADDADDTQLPHTGGGVAAILGVAAFAVGVTVWRRRPPGAPGKD